MTYETAFKTTDGTTAAIRAITTITADPVNSSVKLSITEADSLLAGTAMGHHVLLITAKSTGGVTMNPAVTAEITVRAYYKSCKGANVVTAVSAIGSKNILLDAATSTATLSGKFTTNPASCV